MKRIPFIVSFLLFVLLCVSSSYWVMQLIKPDTRKVSAPQVTKPVANVESVAGLFGGVMLADTTYQLKGVIQANPMDQSVAIIATDNSPEKAYTFNSDVTSGSALNEVFSDYVLLKGNGASKRIDLPQETSTSHITEATRSPVNLQENKTPNRNKRSSRRHSQGMKRPSPSESGR